MYICICVPLGAFTCHKTCPQGNKAWLCPYLSGLSSRCGCKWSSQLHLALGSSFHAALSGFQRAGWLSVSKEDGWLNQLLQPENKTKSPHKKQSGLILVFKISTDTQKDKYWSKVRGMGSYYLIHMTCQFGKIEKAVEANGSDVCTIQWMHLIPLSCTLK